MKCEADFKARWRSCQFLSPGSIIWLDSVVQMEGFIEF